MKFRLNNRAQQIIEYLSLVGVVVAVVLAFTVARGPFRDTVNRMLHQTSDIINQASNDLCDPNDPYNCGAWCGNIKCETASGESCYSCWQDCGSCASCGSNGCEPPGENCNNCPDDCGVCPPRPSCPDGEIQFPEECEGVDFAGKTCDSFAGLTGVGPLICVNCRIDTGNCTLKCGDGIVQGPEETCDPGTTVGRPVCSDGVTLQGCDWCQLDPSQCPVCGNGVIEINEVCDCGEEWLCAEGELNGKDCSNCTGVGDTACTAPAGSSFLTNGTLGCVNCKAFDASQCCSAETRGSCGGPLGEACPTTPCASWERCIKRSCPEGNPTFNDFYCVMDATTADGDPFCWNGCAAKDPVAEWCDPANLYVGLTPGDTAPVQYFLNGECPDPLVACAAKCPADMNMTVTANGCDCQGEWLWRDIPDLNCTFTTVPGCMCCDPNIETPCGSCPELPGSAITCQPVLNATPRGQTETNPRCPSPSTTWSYSGSLPTCLDNTVNCTGPGMWQDVGICKKDCGLVTATAAGNNCPPGRVETDRGSRVVGSCLGGYTYFSPADSPTQGPLCLDDGTACSSPGTWASDVGTCKRDCAPQTVSACRPAFPLTKRGNAVPSSCPATYFWNGSPTVTCPDDTACSISPSWPQTGCEMGCLNQTASSCRPAFPLTKRGDAAAPTSCPANYFWTGSPTVTCPNTGLCSANPGWPQTGCVRGCSAQTASGIRPAFPLSPQGATNVSSTGCASGYHPSVPAPQGSCSTTGSCSTAGTWTWTGSCIAN